MPKLKVITYSSILKSFFTLKAVSLLSMIAMAGSSELCVQDMFTLLNCAKLKLNVNKKFHFY